MTAKQKIIMTSDLLYLQYLTPQMVDQSYVDWLNNPTVNQYLEARFGAPYTLESVRKYVVQTSKDPSTHFFAIFLKENERYIGNVKIGPINDHHHYADIGIMIGDRSSWGKGCATEAIRLAANFAFKKLKVHKLIAGVYSNNIASIKAFTKAGFVTEGCLVKKYLSNNKYVDHVLLGKTSQQ